MLRYGIPVYRLPEAVLDKEIDYLLAHGIEAKTEVRLGQDFRLDDLRGQGFEAIYLAMGSWIAKGMGIENETHANILSGIAFLEGVKRKGPPRLHGTVAIVGGGNTAVDASRTALRCGAEKVAILYRRTESEMPADDNRGPGRAGRGGGDPVPGGAPSERSSTTDGSSAWSASGWNWASRMPAAGAAPCRSPTRSSCSPATG